jgi:hypothetical protein
VIKEKGVPKFTLKYAGENVNSSLNAKPIRNMLIIRRKKQLNTSPPAIGRPSYPSFLKGALPVEDLPPFFYSISPHSY